MFKLRITTEKAKQYSSKTFESRTLSCITVDQAVTLVLSVKTLLFQLFLLLFKFQQ